MSEKEIKEEEKEQEVWSMEDLTGLTEKVLSESIEFRGKMLDIQYSELTENEEPKMNKLKFKNEAEQNEYYQKIGTERVLKMILKANEKSPDNATITEENWNQLPTTLKYTIANKVIGMEQETAVNFR
tara:strand:- start:1610 stop:1993 length:384 start_codon:yes stop_codon:yes gene_type:complete